MSDRLVALVAMTPPMSNPQRDTRGAELPWKCFFRGPTSAKAPSAGLYCPAGQASLWSSTHRNDSAPGLQQGHVLAAPAVFQRLQY